MALNITQTVTYLGTVSQYDKWANTGITFEPKNQYIVSNDRAALLVASGLFSYKDIDNVPSSGIPSFTSASFPGAPAFGVGYVTIDGALYYSDGLTLSRVTAKYLYSSAVPVAIPSSGTMGDNGAITLTTALPNTYSAGIYLYLPANAISAGSAAGFYFATMSTTTTGTVFNNTYTSGAPIKPTNPIQFVTTGPGAYTQITTEQTLTSFTVSGGAMGNYGELRSEPVLVFPSNVNNKTLKAKIGATTFISKNRTATTQEAWLVTIQNRGAANSQLIKYAGAAFGNNSATPAWTSIDTSADFTVSYTGQLAVATDYIILEGANLSLNS